MLNTLKLFENENIYEYKAKHIPINKQFAMEYGIKYFNMKISSEDCTKINNAYIFSDKNYIFVFDPVLQDFSLTCKNINCFERDKYPENFISDENCKTIVKQFVKTIGLDINEIFLSKSVQKRLNHHTKKVYINRRIDGCFFIGRASIGDVEINVDGQIKNADIGIGQFVKYKKVDKIIPIKKAFQEIIFGKGIFSNLSQEHYPGPDLNLGELEKVDIVYHTNDIDKLPDMILKPIYRFVFENDGKGNQPWGFYPASE
jgi:hypothetical protein